MPFDILDATKLIPEEMYPVEVVGRMVLDRNPDNFFAETEQVAFLPTNIVPGIDFSEDPLLQGRLFSYLDTQLSRLGSTNFHQLPINAANGHMQHNVPKGRANYEPNSLASAGEVGGPRESAVEGFRTTAVPVVETKIRVRSETFADHYSQARLFFRSQSPPEQAHLASAIVFELSKVTLEHVRNRVIANLRNVDESLAQRVADGLGMDDLPDASTPAKPPIDMEPSPALRIIGKYPETLKGRAVGVLVADGSDGALLKTLKAAVEEAGADCKVVAPKIKVTLKDGSSLEADAQLAGAPSVIFDAVALVLSEDGCKMLVKESAAKDFVSNAFVHLKAIGYTPEAKPLLDKVGVEADAGIVELGDAAAFLKPAATRQWDREPKVRMLA